jgi:hypothetical protein
MTNNIDDDSLHLQTTSDDENYIVEPRMVNKKADRSDRGASPKKRAVEGSRKERKYILARTRRRAKEVQACFDDALIK